MAEAPDEFEKQVVRNCPSDAPYYYLLRYDENNEPIQFPKDRALRTRTPFEHPIGCKPGDWLVIYSSDSHGHGKIQHVGNKPHVEVRLSLPRSVCEAAPQGATGPTDQDLVEMLTKQQEVEDDADGSLKATRLDAKKREIALDLATKEQKLMLRAAKNKELAEGWMLNRAYRMETRDQSESMFRLQNQSVAMIERQFVLMEKMQETFGRFAEIEKAAAQRLASPPPPVDYTPVLSSVVSAIRDIGVSAMQRDDRKRLKSDEDSPPVKAALADKAPDAGAALSTAEKPTAALAATGSPLAPPIAQPTMSELQALYARAQAERDRLKSELDAERNRQRVLDEIQASSALPSPTTPLRSDVRTERPPTPTRPSSRTLRGPLPPREPGSLFPTSASRNSRCPCGSGRAYKKCCLNNSRSVQQPPKSSTSSIDASTSSSGETARPHPSSTDASTSSLHGTARPHPTDASTSSSPETARPHLPSSDASTSLQHGTARPHPTDASTSSSPGAARPHPSSTDASTSSLYGTARPHPTDASTPPSSGAARPHLSSTDASTPSRREMARPHPTDASTPPSPGAARPHLSSTDASTPSSMETARPHTVPSIHASAPSPGSSPANPVATVPDAARAGTDSSSLPSAKDLAESQGLPFHVPSDGVNPELNELLVNMLAGKMLADPDAPIPPPLVAQVKQMDEVIVKPPKMDPETARKLLNDGSTMEALGAFLFFNPVIRTILLHRRGK